MNFEGAFGGSLGENVAGRIAVASNSYDGILTAINDGEPTDTRNSSGLRASLTWEPTETFSVMAKFSSGSSDGKDVPLLVDGPYSADGTVNCRPAMGSLAGPCPDYDNYAFNPGPNNRTVSYIQPAINATPYLAELDRAGQLLPHPGMAGRKLFAPGGHMYNDPRRRLRVRLQHLQSLPDGSGRSDRDHFDHFQAGPVLPVSRLGHDPVLQRQSNGRLGCGAAGVAVFLTRGKTGFDGSAVSTTLPRIRSRTRGSTCPTFRLHRRTRS